MTCDYKCELWIYGIDDLESLEDKESKPNTEPELLIKLNDRNKLERLEWDRYTVVCGIIVSHLPNHSGQHSGVSCLFVLSTLVIYIFNFLFYKYELLFFICSILTNKLTLSFETKRTILSTIKPGCRPSTLQTQAI